MLGRLGEVEHVAQQRLTASGVGDERMDRVEAPQRELLGDLVRACDERGVACLVDRELVVHALGVGEPQPAGLADDLDALAGQVPAPEVECLLTADAVDNAGDHPGAGAAWLRAGVLEEGDVGTGRAVLVGVEQVVDARVVLVDRLLDQAKTEHARIEVHVARGVAGDQGDVVDAVDRAHGRLLQRLRHSRWHR
jgi:hypothetical protein